MGKIVEIRNHILLCTVSFCCIFEISWISGAGNPLQLDWLTPPPQVVVADIDQVYRIGCRVTINASFYKYRELNIDDIKLWATISKVGF